MAFRDYINPWGIFGTGEKKKEPEQAKTEQEQAKVENDGKNVMDQPKEKEIDEKMDEFIARMSEVITPISSTRQTLPDHGNLYEIVKGMMVVKADFRLEVLDTMDYLAMYNPDVSKALDNLLLANTEETIHFDERASKEEVAEMKRHLAKRMREVYQYSDGINSLKNDLIIQLGLYGCISAEKVRGRNLDGVDSVLRVHPKNIYFHLDEKLNKYIPLQRVPKSLLPRFRGGLIQGEYKSLKDSGYTYIGMFRLGESPYAVPPFLAALENIKIQRDMVANLTAVIEKYGLLGFLTVLMNVPKIKPGETDSQYQQRLKDKLAEAGTEMKKGLKSGILASYRDGDGKTSDKKIEMQNISTNVEGADKLITKNDTYVIAGLKDDPAMMGRDNTTSETFGRVILSKMTSKLKNYQVTLASFLRDLYSLELQMAGFKYYEIDEVEMEPVMFGDKSKEEEAYSKRIDNAVKLRNQNIIDQEQVANMLGYDEAAGEAPDPIDLAGGGQPGGGGDDPDNQNPENVTAEPDPTDSTETENRRMAAFMYLKGDQPEFPYECPSGCTHSFAEDGMTDRERELYASYIADMEQRYKKTARRIADRVGLAVSKFSEGMSREQVEARLLIEMYSEFGEFADQISGPIKKHVGKLYKMYRADGRPFVNKKPPAASFELIDVRIMEFYQRNDSLYLGKFITDEDTRRRVSRWIFDKYADDATSIGRGGEGIAQFKREFAGVLDGESWKIRRVIDTTVNRLRNTGALNYMKQAEVENYEVVSLNDRRTCPYCGSLDGKEFSVQLEYQKIERIAYASPEQLGDLNPFATAVDITPEEMASKSGKDLQELHSLGNPPWHPHCRCRIVIS